LQNTIQDITYAICFPQTCRVEFGLFEPGQYFYIYSDFSAANGECSANGLQCNKGNLKIPTNAQNVAQPNQYCGGHLNNESLNQTDQNIEYYPESPNLFEVSFGEYHSKNGFYLNYTLDDCQTPVTGKFLCNLFI
jgi:hypothetical protein